MKTVAGSTEVHDLSAIELRTLIEQLSEDVFGHPQSFESLREYYARDTFPDTPGSLYLKSLLKMTLSARVPR